MTALSQKDWPKFVVPTCNCGHVEGEHGISHPPAGHAVINGGCLRCECSRFADVQMESARSDPRGLGDGLGR